MSPLSRFQRIIGALLGVPRRRRENPRKWHELRAEADTGRSWHEWAGVVGAAIGVWALSLVSSASTSAVTVGQPADQSYFAVQTVEVEDPVATEAARQAARDAVGPVYVPDTEADEEALDYLAGFFGLMDAAQTSETALVEDEYGNTIPTRSTRPLAERVAIVNTRHPEIDSGTLETLLESGVPVSALRSAAEAMLVEVTRTGVRPGELETVRNQLIARPPLVSLPGEVENPHQIRSALAHVVAQAVRVNERVDEEGTRLRAEEAAAAVEPVTRRYLRGQAIVRQGEIVTEVAAAAISELGLRPEDEAGSNLKYLGFSLAVSTMTMLLFRTAEGGGPLRRKALGVAVLIFASGLSIEVGSIAADMTSVGSWVTPAAGVIVTASTLYGVAAGLISVVPLTGLLLAGGWAGDLVGILAAIGVGVAVLPFSDRISDRHQLRRVSVAVVGGQAAAAAVTWLTVNPDQVAAAALAGGIGGMVAAVGVVGALVVAKTLFGVETDLELEDLTDRNHPALRLLEEKAPGTYNHSLAVGNLAHAAARAIGANELLARAGAYYHDLGKTYAPVLFIENQFGVRNPHERFTPKKSVQAIRRHVIEGVKLAEQYKLPRRVVDIIEQHHGDSILRYFYHQACQEAGGASLDEADFRHVGRKPQTREAGVVMLADAAEAAMRALVKQQEPTRELIEERIQAIVDEKVADHQLDESGLTLGDLRCVTETLVNALVSQYHDRIAYPGFGDEIRTADKQAS